MGERAHVRTIFAIVVSTLTLAAAAPAAAQGSTVVCESTQGERAFCSADTSKGVTLQRQLGDAPCQGNWGWDENGIWVTNRCRGEFLLGQAADQGSGKNLLGTLVGILGGAQATPTPASGTVVVCESRDNRRVVCPADTTGEVELTRQLSVAPCAGAWGTTDNGIWVDRGCRAEFTLHPPPAATPTPEPTLTPTPEPTPGQVVLCESKANRRVVCPVDTSGGVVLTRQLSTAPCAGAWGQTPDGIWVDNGCRAEFTVYPPAASTPTPAPAAARFVVCESKSGQRAFCSADTSGGVELRRRLGSVSCTGRWGYDADGIWVDNDCRAEFALLAPGAAEVPPEGAVICASKRGRRAFCSVDTRKGVTLQRQLGTADCTGHWGYDTDGIWVDNGCRAEFRLGSAAPTPTPTPRPGPGSVVTCAATSGQRSYCPADTRNGVTLQRQLSSAPCVGHWGYDAGGIWVADGCRAEFLIR